MTNESPNKSWGIAILSAAAIIIAAIISLGMPFAERIADRYYPSLTPTANSTSSSDSENSVDLWQFYVDDVKKTAPNSQITVDNLKNIASKVPTSIPYIANAKDGLIPYQYNGNVIDSDGVFSVNCPEGGYAYIAWGNGAITKDGLTINYPWIEGNVYLVLVIGIYDDGTANNLNSTLELSDFASGNVYTNFASPPPDKVSTNKIVNEAWFSQQIWWAQNNKSIIVSIWDLNSMKYSNFSVDPKEFIWSVP